LTEITQRLKNCWDARVLDAKATEVKQDLIRYTIDVTTNLAFAYDGNTLEQNNNPLQQYLEKIFPMVSHRNNTPFSYWRVLKMRADRILEQSLAAIHHQILEIVTECKIRLKKEANLETQPRNMLEAMLIAQQDKDIDFSDEEVFGNILTMLLAGEDTTANTLAWMLHFMTECPNVQYKMQQEADAVLTENQLLNQYEDAARLQYIEAVTYETLRLNLYVTYHYRFIKNMNN
jgi:cytochrome P450